MVIESGGRKASSALRVILSDLPSPAEASRRSREPYQGFAQAGNRFPLFGITR
jgi:hypothetical protein